MRNKIENQLIKILSTKGISQREFARRTGFDPVYINRIINKNLDVRISAALQIAKILEMPVEQIFVGVINNAWVQKE